MNRLVTGALAAAALLTSAVLFTGLADAAPAQNVPLPPVCQIQPPTYPPTPPPPLEPAHHVVNGTFDPGGSGNVTVEGAQPGITYCAVAYSAPFFMGTSTATATGQLFFSSTAVPADFQLNAVHRLDIYRRGFLVSSTPFCVADPDTDGVGFVTSDNTLCNPLTGGSTTGGTTGGTTTTRVTGGSTTGGTTSGSTGGTTAGSTTGGPRTSVPASNPNRGRLPLTGFEMLVLLQVAGVAIGLGAYLRYLRHKRAIGLTA